MTNFKLYDNTYDTIYYKSCSDFDETGFFNKNELLKDNNICNNSDNIFSNFYMSYNNFYHFLIIMFYLLSGFSLMFYVFYKIDSEIRKNKRNLFIVRRLPFLNLDNSIRNEIKSTSTKNYRILSTYDLAEKNGEFDVRNLAKYSSIVFKSFIKLLYKGDHDIYLLNRNQYRWEYECYVLLAQKFNFQPIILEFVTKDMKKKLNDLKSDEIEYTKALNQIKKYDIDNKLITKRIFV
jgi:hypothetical protein